MSREKPLSNVPTLPPDLDDAFDRIVTEFGSAPRCAGSDRCTRPARWRIDLHGCEQAIMCGHHKTAWLRWVAAHVDIPRCAHCRTEFDQVDDAVTVTTI